MPLSRKSAFKAASRSFGYRWGKRRASRGRASREGFVEELDSTTFTDLFKEPYASEALIGFREGVAFEKNGHTVDTFRKTKQPEYEVIAARPHRVDAGKSAMASVPPFNQLTMEDFGLTYSDEEVES